MNPNENNSTPREGENPPEVAALRRSYEQGVLRREDLHEDPIEQFRRWFEEARAAALLEPNAMTLATADSTGRVTARTVLLKAYDQRGFVFFTNYGSRKATQLAENPNAALLFTWLPLERQLAITGRAERISTAESISYFLSRPFGSRLGAWVSDQSRIVSSRSLLEAKFAQLKEKFADGQIPMPEWWGGIRIVPDSLEFWQGGQNRLHDRFLYQRAGPDPSYGPWQIERLQP
jgi:pyridoxamine 5'-phosphate oxidase